MTPSSSAQSAAKKSRARKSTGRRHMQRLRIMIKRTVDEAAHRSRELREGWRDRRARRTDVRLTGADLQIARRWERNATTLLRFGGASTGNHIRMFTDGDEWLEDLWAEIDRAGQRIWFEIYIFEPDSVGLRTLGALTSAARRGGDVRLLVDAVGSSHLTDAVLAPLREAGGRVEFFNPIWRWKRHLPMLRRDHRKVVVIDGLVGYCGGMNISEDYAGARYGNAMFVDCQLRMSGPCVRDLAGVFGHSWRTSTRKRLRIPARPAQTGQVIVQVLASRGWQGRQSIQRSLRISIRNAVETCWITTPYFVPPLRLIRAISRAARRGVDVRVLTAGRSDVPIVAMAARHIYRRLLKHGVRIFEMQDSVLHAKTVVVDGLFATVGSFNLDQWSDKRNLEVNVGMLDASVAREVQEQFLHNCGKAREVTLAEWGKRSWRQRLVHWAAYQLLRL